MPFTEEFAVRGRGSHSTNGCSNRDSSKNWDDEDVVQC